MRVKIIQLGKKDAHYQFRDELIGLIGECEIILNKKGQYKGINFIPNKSPWSYLPVIHFYSVKYKVLEK